MSSVRYSGPTNSTLFTTCCGVAICDDQSRCPSCGEKVPYSPRERHEIAMTRYYGKERLAQMRKESDRKWRKAQKEINMPRPKMWS